MQTLGRFCRKVRISRECVFGGASTTVLGAQLPRAADILFFMPHTRVFTVLYTVCHFCDPTLRNIDRKVG